MSRKSRIENALWGLFAGDALSMPAHWFYNRDNLKDTFNGGVTQYEDAPHPHPESFMVGMEFHPDVKRAEELGRKFDILHEHARFYDTSYSDLEITTGERESEHGNSTPKEEDRYHYHHGMKAGQNTVGAQLVRVLLRSVASEGRYDEDRFLEDFVEFMTSAGNHPDPYTEIYLRLWFENYAAGLPAHACAERQREVWSIGSHGGMIRPMVVALLAANPYQALGFATEHQALTHRSENVTSALTITVPLLHDLISQADPPGAAGARSAQLRIPKINGEEMFKMYRDHKGPGNIPDREMWKLHIDMEDEPFDLANLSTNFDEDEVIQKKFATACYPEHGLPLILFQLAKNKFQPRESLLANTNAGGDNVHRGMVMGLLAGAATEEFPDDLINGLAESESLKNEIETFADIAVSGKGL